MDKLVELKKYKKSKSFQELLEKYLNKAENIRQTYLNRLLEKGDKDTKIQYSECDRTLALLRSFEDIREDINWDTEWGRLLIELFDELIEHAKYRLSMGLYAHNNKPMSEKQYSIREIDLTKASEYAILCSRLDWLISKEEDNVPADEGEDVYDS